MSDDASKFDPRFDPAFQRGYDGPSPESAPRRQPRRSRADSPPEPIGLPPQYSAVEQPRLPERTSDFLQAETLGRRSLDREAHGEPDVDDARATEIPSCRYFSPAAWG